MGRPCRNWRQVMVLTGLLFCVTCARKGEDEAAEPAEVPTIAAETAMVTRQTLTDELTVRGAIAAVPNEDVKISALVGGRVLSLTVAEGDSVRQGQVVATLDRKPFEEQRRQSAAQLEQAIAQVENARANLERTAQLFKRGIAAGKEVEDARTQMASAQAAREEATAALNTANLQIERTEVRAPISGQVVKRMVSVGEQVDGTAAQPIIEVANIERVELGANVPADDLSRVTLRQQATIATPGVADTSLTGEVIAIAPAVDVATNTALVRIRIVNAQRQLRVGMFAEARLLLAEHARALVVPPQAVVKNEDKAFVYVAHGEEAQRTPVMLGLETPTAVEILSGLMEGQTVLTSSVYGLGEKARLRK